MKCLRKFKWVKLPRKEMPELKGHLGYWLKLAESAAFRKGIGTYCGHKNPVDPGMWAGGIVGVKAILGVEAAQRLFRYLIICGGWDLTYATHSYPEYAYRRYGNERGNRYTAWKSRRVIKALEEREQNQCWETAPVQNESGISVALSALYNARVIFSCRNCKNRSLVYIRKSGFRTVPLSVDRAGT